MDDTILKTPSEHEADRQRADDQRTEIIRLNKSWLKAIAITAASIIGTSATVLGTAYGYTKWVADGARYFDGIDTKLAQHDSRLDDHDRRFVVLAPMVANDAHQDKRLTDVEDGQKNIIAMLRDITEKVSKAAEAIGRLQGYNDGRRGDNGQPAGPPPG